MRRRRAVIALGVVLVLAVLVAAVLQKNRPPHARLFLHKATNRLFDVSWGELMTIVGSQYPIADLVHFGFTRTSIRNPLSSASDVKAGGGVFSSNCAVCHGANAQGGTAPALADGQLKHGNGDWALYRNITRGIPGTQMKAMDLGEQETWEVIAYLRSLNDLYERAEEGTAKQNHAPPVGHERLRNAANEPENWLTYSGGYSGQRYTALDQIRSENAHLLRVQWVRQFPTKEWEIEATPLVNHDLVYITEPPDTVNALEAATGKPAWRYQRGIPADTITCCGRMNRGVALLDNRVFVGTVDAHLISLDASSGKMLWDREVGDYRTGLSITGAPLAIDGKIIVGLGGGDFGTRGFLDAYDASSGERLWRFYTVPAPGEPGHETWEGGGDAWKKGGGATWLTGSYDPDLNLVYWGVGNPAPSHQADRRPGDNLYTNSAIALNADTGELVWHFQFTPHDEYDWDANQIPVLIDAEWKGRPRKLVLWANRNAFFYVLDRETGEFLSASAFSKQNWAKEIDQKGRPVYDPAAKLIPQGTELWPTIHGATSWRSPSFSPQTGLMYIPVLEGGGIVYKDPEPVKHKLPRMYLGGGFNYIEGVNTMFSTVRAIDPMTGKIVWEQGVQRSTGLMKSGGLVSTAGGIVFGGDDTRLFVLDARSGEKLWELEVGGRINASPITYSVNGEQRLAIVAGRSLYAIGLPAKPSGTAIAPVEQNGGLEAASLRPGVRTGRQSSGH